MSAITAKANSVRIRSPRPAGAAASAAALAASSIASLPPARPGALRVSLARGPRHVERKSGAPPGRRRLKLLGILDGVPIPIGYRVAFLTAFYREPLLRRMEREHGIIRPEWTVLVCLAYRDGLNARDVAEITEQPSNTVSRGVASLVAKGLVARRPDPADARRGLLQHLLPEGRRVHDAVMATFVAGRGGDDGGAERGRARPTRRAPRTRCAATRRAGRGARPTQAGPARDA